MSIDLHLPVDFERTHEFRLLVNTLKGQVAAGRVMEEKSIEASAVFIYVRLFVELALIARSTNRPGYLTLSGKMLFESTLEPLFGAECSPAKLLLDAQLLQPVKDSEELFCPLFAKLNPHFAGDYLSKEKRGNAKSIVVRQKQEIAHIAFAQASLLPPELYRKRNGEPMNQTEMNRAMVLITTLDNCLKLRRRQRPEYTEALIADAFDISAKYAADQPVLDDIYAWIISQREKQHPGLPETTEQILRDFESIERMVA